MRTRVGASIGLYEFMGGPHQSSSFLEWSLLIILVFFSALDILTYAVKVVAEIVHLISLYDYRRVNHVSTLLDTCHLLVDRR